MSEHPNVALWRYDDPTGDRAGLHMRATGGKARRALAEAISALRPEVEDDHVAFGRDVPDVADRGSRRFWSRATFTIGGAEITQPDAIGLPDGFAEILDEGVREGHEMSFPVDTAEGTDTLWLWWDPAPA